MASVRRLSDLIFRTVTREDLKTTARILATAFTSEPLAARVDCNTKSLEKFVELQSDAITRDGLTLLAETKDGQVVGASMSLDFATRSSKEVQEFVSQNDDILGIVKLLEHLERHYSRHHEYTLASFPRGHSVHMLMLGTEPEYRHRGVASAMRAKAMEHYVQKGYRYTMSEATSDYARRINMAFGFQTLLRISYEDWFPAGSLYARYLDEEDSIHSSVSLMMKKLQ